MMKDKKRDRVRSILPSTGRKTARDESRIINRRTRHRTKQALGEFIEEDGYYDSHFLGKINKTEARHKSEMKWRIMDRRQGDKLGPLMRYVKHVKKRSNSDQEARDKIVQEIKPGQNLITRHAMGHADSELDCPKADYYRPLENERDIKRRENYKRLSVRWRRGKIVWGKRKFKRIVKFLVEHEHKTLNKFLKRSGLSVRACIEGRDYCQTSYDKTTVIREVYDPKRWQNWRRVYSWQEFSKLKEAGEKLRVYKVVSREERHNICVCRNKLMAYEFDDYLVIVSKLLGRSEAIYENDFKITDRYNLHGISSVLKGIKILAEKHNL